jgi:hypothetical protein
MNVFNSFSAFLRRQKKILLLIFVVAATTTLITSAISLWFSNFHNLTLPSVGTIKTIGVEAYWDSDCENKTEFIDWDLMQPGSTKNVSLYIRSVSNVETILDLFAANFTPAGISEYITLSWNYNGNVLKPNGLINLTIFLAVSNEYSFAQYLAVNEVKNFSLDIHIVPYE